MKVLEKCHDEDDGGKEKGSPTRAGVNSQKEFRSQFSLSIKSGLPTTARAVRSACVVRTRLPSHSF